MLPTNEDPINTPKDSNQVLTQETPLASPLPKVPPVDNIKSILVLVFGILSLLGCGIITAIPAILLGRAELKAILEGRSHESNRAFTKIGIILAWISLALTLVVFLIMVVTGIILMTSPAPISTPP